jgi:hypothetical protein
VVSPGLVLRSENATVDHVREAFDLAATRREPEVQFGARSDVTDFSIPTLGVADIR